jgi:hypothetical protein
MHAYIRAHSIVANGRGWTRMRWERHGKTYSLASKGQNIVDKLPGIAAEIHAFIKTILAAKAYECKARTCEFTYKFVNIAHVQVLLNHIHDLQGGGKPKTQPNNEPTLQRVTSLYVQAYAL